MAIGLKDFTFDAYLANDRTFRDPDVIRVENGVDVCHRGADRGMTHAGVGESRTAKIGTTTK